MTQSTSKEIFTVLFVHGAWHTPAFFQPIIHHLEQRGYPSICPHLPTCDASAISKNPQIDMYSDADFIESVLRHLVIDEGKRVIVVPHSYGGVPASQAIPEELGLKQRATAGKSGGVIGILYTTAFLLAPNTSIKDFGGGQSPPWMEYRPDGTSFPRAGDLNFIYNGLDPEEQIYWVSQIVPQQQSAVTSKLTRASYRYIPTGFVVCEEDNGFLPEVQEGMIEVVQQSGVDVLVYRLKSGHSVYLSQPEALIGKILEFGDAVLKG